MRFSVIIPAHNAEDHIRKCLDSIKQQTFTDYELIVICDSCTDRTEEIAKEYGAITKAVEHHCDGPTRSDGLDLAQGEYVLFLDDDDWWLHEYVLTQLDEKLKETANPDVLCFSFIFRHWKYASPHGMSGNRWIAVWNKCWKRIFIGNTRFPDIKFTSDEPFHRAMTAKGGRWVDWDMPMYYYDYMREGSQTQEHKSQIPAWMLKNRGY